MSETEQAAENVQPIKRAQPMTTCPYLGIVDDSETSALYPRLDHRCFVPGTRINAPDMSWQNRYCLSGHHEQCAMFRARTSGDSVLTGSSRQRRRVWAGAAIGILLVLLIGAAFTVELGSSHSGLDVAGAGSHNSSPTAAVGMFASPTGTTSTASGAGTPVAIVVETPVATPSTTATVPEYTPTPAQVATATGAPSETTKTPAAATPPPVPTGAAPTPTPASATSTPAGPRTHVVAAGETLSEIAVHYGVSAQSIIDLNHIQNPDVIDAGTVLKIPSP